METETSPADRLLAHLRGRLGPDIAFAEPPTPLSGGFDTTILAFLLGGAPPDWSGPLILRVMTRSDLSARVRREAAVHAALVQAGFPAPRVLWAESDAGPLGRPFLIMERLAGRTMWDELVADRSLASFLSLPRRLADIHAGLHRVGGQHLRECAREFGVDPETLGVEADVRRLSQRIERSHLDGLIPGAHWLLANIPAPAQPEVICHGDFHPLNIMVESGRFVGLIDWANAAIAEPAFDIAGLRVIALHADPGLPPWAWSAAGLARRLMVRRYMSLYRAALPFDVRNLAYYEAIRVLSALAIAGEPQTEPGNPWKAPHTVAALLGRFEQVSGVRVRI